MSDSAADVRDVRAVEGRGGRGTSWAKLIPRMIGASNKGYAIRVQMFIDGEWRYVGQRRAHRGR